MTDHFFDFAQAMKAVGLETDTPLLADDKVHRFHILGDKRGKMNAAYQLAIEGAFAFGWFKSFKDGIPHKWHSRHDTMTVQETAALRKKVEERRAVAEKERKALAVEARERAGSIWGKAMPTDRHPYLGRKGVALPGVRLHHQCLVIPASDKDGLATLQFISQNGDKRFLKDAPKAGSWFIIPGTTATVALCEGAATGGTIAAATGWQTHVCFDSGNMKVCARRLRELYPDAEIVICADDDRWVFRHGQRPEGLEELPHGDDERWTEWRSEGRLFNPGMEAAAAVLSKVGGSARITAPKSSIIATRPTDFNDLQHLEGLDAVKLQLTAIIAPAPSENEEESPPDQLAGYVPVYDPENISAPIESGPFKIMGHDNGIYYYLPRGSGQIVELSATAHSKTNLYRLAPLSWWEERFGGPRGVSWDHAANALLQFSHQRGIFSTETMLRGAGVWRDKGRIVVHMGDKLRVDGQEIDPFTIGSAYVYQASKKVYDLGSAPLENKEAIKLRKICELCTWENPLSAVLLAGWLVMAPISGALDWRPHIWITGESQAGKSFVINRIVKAVLTSTAVRVSSGSTEAGIRQIMGCSARPVILDEMESESEVDEQTVQAVLMLARKASSGDVIIKGSQNGTAKVFGVYSCFCFSAINPSLKQRADESRVTLLGLRKNRSANARAEFRDLKEWVRETLTEEYAQALMTRTVQNIETLLKNSETFTDAAAEVMGEQRAADQIGPMLAGAYSLGSLKEITPAQAKEWIMKHDWKLHTTIAEQADHERLFDHLMSCRITINGSIKHETQIGMAIQRALGYLHTDYSADHARIALQNIDIKVLPGNDNTSKVLLRKPSQHISRLLRGTAWSVNWPKALTNIMGVALTDTPARYGKSSAHAVVIPGERFKPEGSLL